MLRSDLCDYSDACIVAKRTSTIETEGNRSIDDYNRDLILENNNSFINCILKIDNVLIENAEGLDIVMPSSI